LKELIEEQYKFEKSSQTLIYAGKILPNEKTIEECKIGAEDFLVLMVKKVATTTKTPAPEKPTTTPTPEKPATTVTTPAPATPAGITSTTNEPVEYDKTVSETLLTGAELEKAVSDIVEMGFPRDLVINAMRASFNNPARAVDYLMNGLPSDVAPPPQQTPAVRLPRTTNPTSPASPTLPQAPAGTGVFDGLRAHPQFAQLCLLAQQGGEEALKQILTYFAQTNRPLLELIMQNQDEFIRLLSSPVPGTAGGGLGVGPGAPPPGVIRVHVTPEDERVITNLVNMGFERNRVMEAYFLFEKDETMTANYLLNNPDFDGDASGDTGSQ